MSKKNISMSELPFISVCTPTYNRRHFIPALIKCFQHQTYPKHLLEWVIIDDGEDAVEDLFQDIPEAKYHRITEKMKLGQKRNFMNSKATGDILVYMDDDDYYPPERVMHAVDKLMLNKKYMVAGCSKVYTYFIEMQKIYSLGPYGPNHTIGTNMAFHKELLQQTQFEDAAECSEEKFFLNGFTIPLLQLNPRKTCLLISHSTNTFDKRQLLLNPTKYIRPSNLSLENFIPDGTIRDIFLNLS